LGPRRAGMQQCILGTSKLAILHQRIYGGAATFESEPGCWAHLLFRVHDASNRSTRVRNPRT
jgi:hypothetical protein